MLIRRHHASIVAAVTTVVTACSMALFAQPSPNELRIQATPKPAEVALFENPVEIKKTSAYTPELKLSVNPTLQLNEPTRKKYENLAALINGSKIVPNSRLEYYSAFNNHDVFHVKGWVGYLQNVESDGSGGFIVSVQLTPTVECTNYGLNSIVADTNYYETYHVIGNAYSYIESFDPAGTRGKMPAIIQI